MLSFFKKDKKIKELAIMAPITGQAVSLEQVPDPAFAGKMMGEGAAIEPAEGKMYAPFDGKVAQLIKSKHAVILEHESGAQVLIHVGIDTVSLKGSAFSPAVQTGDKVKQGQLIMEFDMDMIREAGLPVITPVIVPVGIDAVQAVQVHDVSALTAGKDTILTIKLG
ncbi:PTS glucose transporter subunit IIA [Paenibacillus terreus]|uniref:PTS glucose transporter subunit IIA n=1 Tax=Paenibacillus terreus TaxID=1387834 RepID=A0ABV5BHA0_9BACL